MSNPPRPAPSIADRLAGGPISWGVCEVPGWGRQLPPDDVLAEMRSLGLRATETGPEGYLGADASSVRRLLERHDLALVGGFLPLVLHDRDRLDASLAKARATALLLGSLAASVLCSAAVVDDGWSPRVELSEREWEQLLAALPLLDEIAAGAGLLHALHPHWGTLVEREADVGRVLAGSTVRLCLDTGHLALGGTDPLALAREVPERIVHAHLKDVRGDVAERLRSGALSLVQAVRAGLFRPLGEGVAPVGDVVLELEGAGYRGWYVLEQDAALPERPLPEDRPPRDDVRRSIEFLRRLAPTGDAVSSVAGGR